MNILILRLNACEVAVQTAVELNKALIVADGLQALEVYHTGCAVGEFGRTREREIIHILLGGDCSCQLLNQRVPLFVNHRKIVTLRQEQRLARVLLLRCRVEVAAHPERTQEVIVLDHGRLKEILAAVNLAARQMPVSHVHIAQGHIRNRKRRLPVIALQR